MVDASLYQALTRVVAILNGKGGVGKTSITTNLGAGIAASGRKVLIVELDPQGNIARDLGSPRDMRHGGAELFDSVARQRSLTPTLRDVRPGLDVVAGGPETGALGAWLEAQPSGDPDTPYRLALALAEIAPNYDLVLLDNPPGEAELQQAALNATRWLIVPSQTDAASRDGLEQIATRFEHARRNNPYLELLGVVLALVPSAASGVRDEARAAITKAFGAGSVLFDTTIRYALRPAHDCREKGVAAAELAQTNSNAESLARDYQQLTDEFLTRWSAAR